MTISIGDRLPDVKIKKVGPQGAEDVSTGEFFSGRRVVLVGVPAAFSPGCTNNHLPGFIENYNAIRARDVDVVAVLAVNDHFVMGAWAKATAAENKLVFLADGNGTFTRAIGMEADLTAGGLGMRSRRFSMLIDDGSVKELNVEEARGQVTNSGVAHMLEQL